MKYELPPLPYAYDALEPVIDAKTMELHHGKHHATYVAKLNEALEKEPSCADSTLEKLLGNMDAVPPAIRTAVRNHGGGHHNHSLFWNTLRPAREGNAPEGMLAEKIAGTFGSFDIFKEQFAKDAVGVFGSGWCWLALSEVEGLKIITTPNQDSPLMQGLVPVIGLDVWEHAYYLKHQNRRADYVNGWWSIVNWKEAEERYGK